MLHAIGGSIALYYFLVLIEFCLLAGITAYWLRCMQRAMEACHSVSRASDPNLVWLTFIPLFGFIWQFIMVNNLSLSLRKEYRRRGWVSLENHPTMELGMLNASVVCLIFVLNIFLTLHPVLVFFGELSIVFFMYRHADQVNTYRERLEKEIDPSTAFGQFPIANTNHPFMNQGYAQQQNNVFSSPQTMPNNFGANNLQTQNNFTEEKLPSKGQAEKSADDLDRWRPKK